MGAATIVQCSRTKNCIVTRPVDWNAELVRGDLGGAVQQLKLESGKGLLLGGVKLPLALAELGLIDEYEFLERREFGSGVVTMRYGPRR